MGPNGAIGGIPNGLPDFARQYQPQCYLSSLIQQQQGLGTLREPDPNPVLLLLDEPQGPAA
jgi:hypothetical protein